jgi:hypothetical protein
MIDVAAVIHASLDVLFRASADFFFLEKFVFVAFDNSTKVAKCDCVFITFITGTSLCYSHYNYRISLLIVLTLKDDVGARSESSRNFWQMATPLYTAAFHSRSRDIIDRSMLFGRGFLTLLYVFCFFPVGGKTPWWLTTYPFQKNISHHFWSFSLFTH